MFSLYGLSQCEGRQPTRRELLRVGGLSLLGLSSTQLGRLRKAAAGNPKGAARRHHSCVFVFLFGGPSRIDLWDMKPQAPAEIRGEFKPAATKAPGLELCEHLPLLAGQADQLCLLRSMTHHMPVHGPACSEMFVQNGMTQKTGRDHWPHAFTVLLAGGGVRGGQVYGATSKTGGYVDDKPVSPADLAATILWHLGIDSTQSYFDEFQRIEQQLCEGRPIRDL